MMKKDYSIRYTVLAAVLLSAVSVASAQHTDRDSLWKDMTMQEVVVTGTRTPKLLKDTPIQTRVISSQDLQRADATNIQDLLEQELPGVEFSYAKNQLTHLNLSGFGGQGILFLVDGERLAGETMDDVDFTRLNMDNVERIEIVRGAASALYGSNATGGVVNIITKKASKPWNLGLSTRHAKHGEQRYGATFGLKSGWVSNSLTLNHNRMDNFSVESEADPVTQVISTVYGDKVWNVKDQLLVKPSEKLSVTAKAGYFFREVVRSEDVPERYRDFSGGIRMNWKPSVEDAVEVAYTFDQYDKSDYQRRTKLDIRDYSNVQNSFRGLYSHEFSGGNIVTVGTDYMHDYLMNLNLEGRVRKQDQWDAFAQYDWRINRQWELVGALRYDYFSDKGDQRLTPKLNARFNATDNLNLRAGYGMGFRAPALKERYYDLLVAGMWIIEGNENLRSELSHNFNAAVEYTKGHYNVTLSAYYNKVKDKIATAAPYFKTPLDKVPYMQYNNLEDYSVYGAEMALQARWNNGLGARMAYVYTKEELPKDADGNIINNQYIPARAHSLNVRINYDRRFSRQYALSASLNGRFLSAVENLEYRDYYDISKGTVAVEYPAYTIWKLSLTNSIGKAVKVNIAVDNILNYRPRYYYLNSPLTDGRNLMVGVAIDVDRFF